MYATGILHFIVFVMVRYIKAIIISSLEHTSITSPVTVMQEEGFEVDVIPLTKEGIIDIEELKKLL